MKMSQLAGMNLHYIHHTWDCFCDAMVRFGLKNIELYAAGSHFNYYSDNRIQQAKHIAQSLKARNLKLACVTPDQCYYPINIAAPEPQIRRASIEYLRWYLENCHIFGTHRVLITSGWGYYDHPVQDAWARAIDALQQLGEIAQCAKSTILFEVLLPFETNLANSLSSFVQMAKEVAHESVLCCVDTAPVCAEKKRLLDYFEALNEKVAHIHLVDGTPLGHLTWGDGNQPLDRHIDDMNRYHYAGCMTLELEDGGYRLNPDAAYERGLTVLSKHMENDIDWRV